MAVSGISGSVIAAGIFSRALSRHPRASGIACLVQLGSAALAAALVVLRHPLLRQRRVLCEVAFDAAQHRACQFFLVGIVFQALLFFRVADEGGLDEDRRYLG